MTTLAEELFSKPIPEQVWHYTTIEALEGILSSNKLWATDSRFTNDKTEFIHAKDIARTCIANESLFSLTSFPPEELVGMMNRAFDEGPLSPVKNEIYLISFSEAPDLLTQWGLYANGSTGVGIAFDLRTIRPPKEAGIAVTFAPCVYEANEKQELVASCFNSFTDTVRAKTDQVNNRAWMYEQLINWQLVDRKQGSTFNRQQFEHAQIEKMKSELIEAWSKTVFDLLRVASHCKHQDFFAEHEWRLAMPRPADRPSQENPIKFRGTNDHIPYFESDLFGLEKLPITEIMLGPLCTQKARVENAIQQNGHDCLITESSIPLRNPQNM